MDDYILHGGYIIDKNNQKEYINIHIKDQKTYSLDPDMNSDVKKIDITDKLITQGLVDMHVHLRYPGQSHKEDLHTGSEAALKGGYTNIYAMPNTKPIIDNVELLKEINDECKKLPIHVKHYASITEQLKSTELTDMKELSEHCAGFTNDGVGVQKTALMYEAMKTVNQLKLPIVAHAEDDTLLYGGVIHEGIQNKKMNLKGIMSASEYIQVGRDIDLCKLTGAKYHVCHISCSETVNKIKAAKLDNVNITCEVTPHHLILNELDVVDSNHKMNPPLRSEKDQEALINGINDGTIDVIATDHAPHSESEKNQQIDKAPFGIIGLEHAFSLCYTNLVKKDKLTLRRLIELMSINPRKIMKLNNSFEIGNNADFTVIDLESSSIISKDNIVSKSKNTPFLGYEVFGLTEYVIVDGRIVYENV